MNSIAAHFTWIDWLVVGGYLALTTYIGHALKGSQATIQDFFLAGRRLPWPAVCGSIIATEISALTFVGVPGMVFAANGNFTYLQWAIGSIIARCLVGIYLVPRYYAHGVYSPYEYMHKRLGRGAKTLTTFLFFLGSILGQSVRVLVTAIILDTVTPLDFRACILIIGAFAILWTLMGGMATVIWTDVVQFGLFVGGGVLSLVWILASLDGGISQYLHVGAEAGKFKLLDLGTHPMLEYTLWVGIIAMPFQNLAAFGTDQLNTQRMFCCRTPDEAKKAMICSSFSQVITVLMLLVGAGLFAYFQQFPLEQNAQALLDQKDTDYVYPIWIVLVLPVGISGLVLAGAFAAAISSLDSILTALSQATLSLIHGDSNQLAEPPRKMLLQSRLWVVFWGIALPLVAIGINEIRGDVNLISLAFGMVAYTYGPLLGILVLALIGRKVRLFGVWGGILFSILITLYVKADMYNLFIKFGVLTAAVAEYFKPPVSYPWLYPVTCLVTVGCGLLFSSKTQRQ